MVKILYKTIHINDNEDGDRRATLHLAAKVTVVAAATSPPLL